MPPHRLRIAAFAFDIFGPSRLRSRGDDRGLDYS
jgi:hypothetical protein